MQQDDGQHIPLWIQWALTLGIPGSIALWAKWSAKQAVMAQIDEKLEPIHKTLKTIGDDVAYMRGRFAERDRQ